MESQLINVRAKKEQFGEEGEGKQQKTTLRWEIINEIFGILVKPVADIAHTKSEERMSFDT